MKKAFSIILALLFIGATSASAQSFLKKAAEAAKKVANQAVEQAISGTTSSSTNSTSSSTSSGSSAVSSLKSKISSANGPVYYVSEEGSNRADGKSPSTAMKDIQRALNAIADAGQNGATVRVAEGNYLGYLDAGYIEIKNWITLEGGWNSDFTSRDPFTHITKMQPDADQMGTNGSKALITISGLDNTNYTVDGTLIIDGIMLDYGYETVYYKYDPSDPVTGSPEGVDTGRMVDDGAKQIEHQCIHSDAAIAGNVIIRNCLFMNSPYFGIQINSRCGEIEICNCVFVSNRYGAVRIDGWDKEGYRSHVNFHHNSVGFSWCRDKMMEDMGYGYEFMNKISGDLDHNIFFCNNYAAIARTRSLSGPDSVIEAKKVTNVTNNLFYMNASDIQLASAGGGKWTNVMVKQFDDIDEKVIPKIDGNKNMSADDPWTKALWEPYLNGFATLKVLDSSASFNANSADNLYRQAHGMNMQGTEIHRVSMYANRYRFDEAMKLFGAKEGYGAQK